MTTCESLILGIIASLAASVVFWLLTFKISGTAVIFSEVIERSISATDEKCPRYRIRIANNGNRDLIEVSIKAKIIVRLSKDNTTFLDVGNGGYMAILPRRKKGKIQTSTVTIYPGELALGEYKKSFYCSSIREKAEAGNLSVEDIFESYGDKVSIIIYVFGNDHLTGARRLAQKEYSRSDIKEGSFQRLAKRKRKNKSSAVELISNISPIEEYSRDNKAGSNIVLGNTLSQQEDIDNAD